MNLPNFQNLDAQDGTVYGRHNTIKSVNPYKCYFVAHYPQGNVVRGYDLFTTGWDDIPQGLTKLEYILSTGHKIEIPKFRAYMPLIEVSVGMDGSRIFHSINVKCLAEKEVLIYKIILRQDNISKYKIGDIIIGKEKRPMAFGPSWKFTS
jgi:hypothetical protein